MSAKSRPRRNRTKKKMLLAKPMGQFHRCSRTTSHTQTPPVTNPQASAIPIVHQFRYEAANTNAEAQNITSSSAGFKPDHSRELRRSGSAGAAMVVGLESTGGGLMKNAAVSIFSLVTTFCISLLDMVLV